MFGPILLPQSRLSPEFGRVYVEAVVEKLLEDGHVTYGPDEGALVELGAVREQEGNNGAMTVPSGIVQSIMKILLPLFTRLGRLITPFNQARNRHNVADFTG